MKIGFSGTRRGMSNHQIRTLTEWMEANADIVAEFHHGMCVGADTEAHGIVRAMLSDVEIHGHPGFEPTHPMVAKELIDEVDVLHGQDKPMDRNRVIADTVDMMLFAPDYPETRRSGTWATFRYCRKKSYGVVMIPKGTYVNPKGL